MAERRIAIAETPLRIGCAGGGTDTFGGSPCHVVSFAINRFVTVVAGRHFFPDDIRASYSKTEDGLKHVSQIEHPTIRESMRLTRLGEGHQTTTVTDIPWRGTGLGSSSSCTVGLLHAYHALRREQVSQWQLAAEAIKIERDVLREHGGVQDQVMAAYGGIKEITFEKTEPGTPMHAIPINVKDIPISNSDIQLLEQHTMLFYTGIERSSASIHTKQAKEAGAHAEEYELLRQNAREMARAIAKADMQDIGELLREGWEIKRKLTEGVSTAEIDAWYAKARAAGMMGGKITGAGGGGFLFGFASPDKQPAIRKALPLRDITTEAPFGVELRGSRILYVAD